MVIKERFNINKTYLLLVLNQLYCTHINFLLIYKSPIFRLETQRNYQTLGINMVRVMPISQPVEDLSKCITSACMESMENSPNQWGMVDLNAHVAYFNPVVKKLFNLKHSYNESGRHYKEIPHPVFEKYADRFYLHDSYIIAKRRPSQSLQVHKLSGGWKAYIENWTPVFNKQRSEVVGLRGEGTLLDDFWLRKIELLQEKMKLEKLTNREGVSLEIRNHPKLSQRETEVLFLMMLDKSIKEIANCLCSTASKNTSTISTSTVYTYIKRIKEKFGVMNDKALIEYVFQDEYQNYIPPSFLCRNMSLILD